MLSMDSCKTYVFIAQYAKLDVISGLLKIKSWQSKKIYSNDNNTLLTEQL